MHSVFACVCAVQFIYEFVTEEYSLPFTSFTHVFFGIKIVYVYGQDIRLYVLVYI